jgi:hypothetical protein
MTFSGKGLKIHSENNQFCENCKNLKQMHDELRHNESSEQTINIDALLCF